MSIVRRFDALVDPASSEPQSFSLLRTGIRGLDRIENVPAGSLVVIGGRPGMGKSTLSYQIALATARVSGPVLIVSAQRGEEESAEFMRQRLSERDAQLPSTLPLFFGDVPWMDSVGLLAAIGNMPKPVSMILIDGYEAIRPDADRSSPSRLTPYFLKHLATSLNTHIVVTHGIPGFSGEREDFRPRLTDIAGSDPLRDVANLVLGLFRESVYDPEREGDVAEVSVLRNRHGPMGACVLRFTGNPPRFVEG